MNAVLPYIVFMSFLVRAKCGENDVFESLLSLLQKRAKEENMDNHKRQLKEGEDASIRGLLIEGLHQLSEKEKRDHVIPYSKDWNKYECDDDYIALRKTVNALSSKYCRKSEPKSSNKDGNCTPSGEQCPETSACCTGLLCRHWICRKPGEPDYDIWHKPF